MGGLAGDAACEQTKNIIQTLNCMFRFVTKQYSYKYIITSSNLTELSAATLSTTWHKHSIKMEEDMVT